jgi:peptidoglycan-associated lipoprotein
MIKRFIRPLCWLAMTWAVGACTPSYKAAQAKFELGEYQEAIPLFEEALQKTPEGHEKGKIHFFIAESYRLSNRLGQATDAYSLALSEKYFNDKVGLYYGLALKAKGEYAKAATQLESYIRTGTDGELVKRAKMELQHLAKIDSISHQENRYVQVRNLSSVNSPASDYGAALLGGQLVFASTRRSEKTYAATGEGFADLYLAVFSQPEKPLEGDVQLTPFPPSINADGLHEASATFSPDGQTMIFARSNSGNKKESNVLDVNLYESSRRGGGWDAPVLLDFLCNEKKWDGSPAFSADGQTLYFASEREDGYGGLDLYYSKRDGRGGWSRPKNLGREINTPGNEMFPYVDAEGRLYFASDGHAGLGGLDLFVAERKEGSVTVRNLGKPFNSPADDFGLVKYASKAGFFTSSREAEGAQGGDDLYHYIDETPETHTIHYLLSGTTFLSEKDQSTVLADVRVTLKDASGKELESIVSDGSGRFSFKWELDPDKAYRIHGMRGQEYLDEEVVFTASGQTIDPNAVQAPDTTVVLTASVTLKKNEFLVLDRSEGEDAVITLNNILYDLDKWDIRPDAALELDKLVEYMKRRPNMRVELGSHTDVRGNHDYNMELSQKRAQSAVDYIVKQGIDASRIVAKGYGETDLLIENAQTEPEHQLNRRTTVKVLAK